MTRACWNCGKLVSDAKFCSSKCEERYKNAIKFEKRGRSENAKVKNKEKVKVSG